MFIKLIKIFLFYSIELHEYYIVLGLDIKIIVIVVFVVGFHFLYGALRRFFMIPL